MSLKILKNKRNIINICFTFLSIFIFISIISVQVSVHCETDASSIYYDPTASTPPPASAKKTPAPQSSVTKKPSSVSQPTANPNSSKKVNSTPAPTAPKPKSSAFPATNLPTQASPAPSPLISPNPSSSMQEPSPSIGTSPLPGAEPTPENPDSTLFPLAPLTDAESSAVPAKASNLQVFLALIMVLSIIGFFVFLIFYMIRRSKRLNKKPMQTGMFVCLGIFLASILSFILLQ